MATNKDVYRQETPKSIEQGVFVLFLIHTHSGNNQSYSTLPPEGTTLIKLLSG